MELATTLKGHTVHNAVREAGINKNHWYPVAWAHDLKVGEVIPVAVWQQSIALFRDESGQLHAIDNACPHKGVELHKGKVQGSHLLCPYHGWEFNGAGECVGIPYLPPDQKLPCAIAPSFAVAEKYGIIWVFPGDRALASERSLPNVPEYDDPAMLAIPITGHFRAHFSICNENTMDVFHGFLHNDLQGWFDPILLKLSDTGEAVCADYQVTYEGWITKFLGLSKDGNKTTRNVSIHYNYPHYHTTMEGVSSLHLMRLPVSPTETRSFSLLFLKLPFSPKLLAPIEKPFVWFIRRFIFMKFLLQDVEMMESEQRTFSKNSRRRYVEINPAIIALQRLILRQYEQFMQQSSQMSGQAQNGDSVRPSANSIDSIRDKDRTPESIG